MNAYREGGWLPSWASPGYRNCMVGTFADVVVADAIIKDIKGFDMDTAIEAIRKDSFEQPPPYAGGAVGKDGLKGYIEMGFIPLNNDGGGESVSRSLDFAYADYAVAQALKHAANNMDYVKGDVKQKERMLSEASGLEARAHRALAASFDPSLGLMVPRTFQGSRINRFDALTWYSILLSLLYMFLVLLFSGSTACH